MIRSLFSAVSGLTAHQEAMDVVGNDIANVNTVGFKSSSTEFSEAFSQTERLASDSQPIGLDVGLGVRVAGTVTDFSQGAFQATSVPSNIAISGNGFFVINTTTNALSVSATAATTGTGNTLYTRAGDFTLDSNGYLRTSDGYYVMGYSAGTSANAVANGTTDTVGFVGGTVYSDFTQTVTTATIASTALSAVKIPTTITIPNGSGGYTQTPVVNYSVGSTGAVTAVGADGTNVNIGYVTLATFQNNNGLDSEGAGYYTPTKASGVTGVYTPGNGTAGSTQGGTVELSNADVATQFANMIIIQRGYDANAKVITTSNEMLQTADNLIQ